MFNLLNKIKINSKNLFSLKTKPSTNFDFIKKSKLVLGENYKLKTSAGFTLIESMVAISILLIAITGPLVVARQGLVASRFAKNQITAFYLAQDAIEYIRSVRDSNFLSGSGWLTNLTDCEGSYCQVDVTTSLISTCGAECPLLRKSVDGLYGYNVSWSETNFRRNVRLYQRSSTNLDEVYIEVEILWDHDGKNFKVRESLFNLN